MSEDQFLVGFCTFVAIAAFSLAATSLWSARKGHCPLMGFALSWLLPGFLATLQHDFMGQDTSVCFYMFAVFVAASSLFISAFSMLFPVSLVSELKSCAASGFKRQEKTKQTFEVEEAQCFMVPPCNSISLMAMMAAAALLAAVKHYEEVAAAASCGAFVVGKGATFVILFGTWSPLRT